MKTLLIIGNKRSDERYNAHSLQLKPSRSTHPIDLLVTDIGVKKTHEAREIVKNGDDNINLLSFRSFLPSF